MSNWEQAPRNIVGELVQAVTVGVVRSASRRGGPSAQLAPADRRFDQAGAGVLGRERRPGRRVGGASGPSGPH